MTIRPPDEFFEEARSEMIEAHLKARDITDPAVLHAMEVVPRHRFVPPVDWDEAYEDHPLRIASGQTISQPYIVAYMTQLLALAPGMTVLEIGTGSGYQTAILAEMGARVVSIERHPDLSEGAAVILDDLGVGEAIELRVGDGTLGARDQAPFDRIIVTAAGPTIPPSLQEQLAEGGRMVIPVGTSSQRLEVITRQGERFTTTHDLPVIFVPLIGEEGAQG